MAGARARTSVLINLAMVVEQANEQVLPAVYLFVGKSLNATPVQLGTLTLCRAMVQTLASPLSGILGDRYDRVVVLSSGAFIWGVMTSAMALTATLQQAMLFAALNGLGLALLVPCCQSLTADLYPAEQRGRAFGTLQLTASLGGMMGGVFATNVGGMRVAGMDGWRAAFHTIAALSLLVGALALWLAVDPRRLRFIHLLPSSVDVTQRLLADEPSPGTSSVSSHASDEEHAAAVGGSSTATATGGRLDRRRPAAQGHATYVVLHTSDISGAADAAAAAAAAAAGKAAAWGDLHNGISSWHAGDDTATDADNAAGGGSDRALAHSSSSSALQHRASKGHHAGEQLMLGPVSDSSSHQSLPQLHTTSTLQQRVSASASASPLRDSRSHQHQHHAHEAAAAHHGGSSSSHDGSPRKQPPADSSSKGRFRRRGVVGDVCWMLQIKTFQAIVLQGIVGCFPWQALVFFTVWLQLSGFSNGTASLLVATFGAGVAMGGLLGGTVGDRMARRMPNNGRIFTAQFSVFCGIPLTWVLLKGLPVWAPEDPAAFGAVLLLMGLSCTWAGTGCNSPMFAEIVPDELRSTIYAFDRSFESSIAACAAPVVGLLAERVFGFSGVLNDDVLKDKALRAHNAAALGSALLACTTLPWSLCLLFYSVLHVYYPKDRQRARAWGAGGAAVLYHH